MKIIMKMSEKEMDKIMEVCNEASIVPMDDTCFNHKVHMKYGEIIMDSDGNGYIEIDIGERAILFFMNKYSTAISLFKNIIGLIKTFCKELIDDVEAMFITDEEPEVTIDDMTMEEYIDKIMKSEVDEDPVIPEDPFKVFDEGNKEEKDKLLIYKLHDYMRERYTDISLISVHGLYKFNNAINFHGDGFHVFQVEGDDFVYIASGNEPFDDDRTGDKIARSIEEALNIIDRE